MELTNILKVDNPTLAYGMAVQRVYKFLKREILENNVYEVTDDDIMSLSRSLVIELTNDFSIDSWEEDEIICEFDSAMKI